LKENRLKADERLFYIVSVRYTRKDSQYLSVWRPNNEGYAYPLPWAGRYSDAVVRREWDYYHNGFDSIAVPCEILDALGVLPSAGAVDGDVGPVIPNTKATWSKIMSTLAWPLPYTQLKGARSVTS